jgi:hypothetical protein
MGRPLSTDPIYDRICEGCGRHWRPTAERASRIRTGEASGAYCSRACFDVRPAVARAARLGRRAAARLHQQCAHCRQGFAGRKRIYCSARCSMLAHSRRAADRRRARRPCPDCGAAVRRAGMRCEPCGRRRRAGMEKARKARAVTRCASCGKPRKGTNRSRLCRRCIKPIETAICRCGNTFTPWYRVDGSQPKHARNTCGRCSENPVYQLRLQSERSQKVTKRRVRSRSAVMDGIPCPGCGRCFERVARNFLFCSPGCKQSNKRRLQSAGLRLGDMVRAVRRGESSASDVAQWMDAWKSIVEVRRRVRARTNPPSTGTGSSVGHAGTGHRARSVGLESNRP